MPAPGYTYFVRRGGAIKIGCSTDPKQRISTLQTASVEKLETLAIVPDSVVTEEIAHARFSDLRIRGEWFRADPRLLRFIHKLDSKRCPKPPSWSHLAPDIAKVMAELQSIRIKNAGNPPVIVRASIMMSNIELLQDPEITPEHRAELLRTLKKATAEIQPLLAA
jgi:hypothetical protein